MSNIHYSAIQYMAMIMKSEKFKLEYVLEIVEIINNSYLSSKDIIQIMEQIFKNEKSGKILLAVGVLEYLVKNCNRNFHQAANRESFQKALLSLLKRVSYAFIFSKEEKRICLKKCVPILKTGAVYKQKYCIQCSYGTMHLYSKRASIHISSIHTKFSGNKVQCFLREM